MKKLFAILMAALVLTACGAQVEQPAAVGVVEITAAPEIVVVTPTPKPTPMPTITPSHLSKGRYQDEVRRSYDFHFEPALYAASEGAYRWAVEELSDILDAVKQLKPPPEYEYFHELYIELVELVLKAAQCLESGDMASGNLYLEEAAMLTDKVVGAVPW